MELLTNLREINVLLQKTAAGYFNFNKMSEVLSNRLKASVFIISNKGKLLGYAGNLIKTEPLRQILGKRQFSKEFSDYLLHLKETIPNLDSDRDYPAIEIINLLKSRFITIVPIIGGENRLGTLIIAQSQNPFHEDALFLAEYGATISGIKMLHLINEEMEEEARSRKLANKVISSLSYSELEAVELIIKQLNAKEGLLVASRIADQFGITRSILVGAIRKLKGAGLVDSRSLGMKGTYIKILNANILTELKEVKHRNRVYGQNIG